MYSAIWLDKMDKWIPKKYNHGKVASLRNYLQKSNLFDELLLVTLTILTRMHNNPNVFVTDDVK